ncbi:MAG: transporter substrate-binding domain-containing protein [Eubacteriales bacterium]|nr:transporter substrate-binding domain-containing protein [Eubacteriales bacterium]
MMLLVCILHLYGLPSVTVRAEENDERKQAIRVGFFEFDGYHEQDEEGNKTGYGYDFLQMIAPYADFQYEYVGYDKSWSEMQEMLQNGEIDILTSAKKTPEREVLFDFSEKSIGSSFTMITTRPDNMRYTTADYSTLEGIRVGLLEGNSRNISFHEYAKKHGFAYDAVYYHDQDEMLEALEEGKEIDAIVTSDLRRLGNEIVIDKFDESKFYAIVKKGNQELMDRINDAISCLDTDSPGWKFNLAEKYYNRSSYAKELSLTMEEKLYMKELISSRRKLKVLLNPDLPPYSYVENGKPKGIMVDILSSVSRKVGFQYEIINTESTEEYDKLIQSGQADIIFDAAFDYNQAEKSGYYLTAPYIFLTDACVTKDKNHAKARSVAVKESDEKMKERYATLYKDKKIVYCDTIEDCIEAVRKGKADCTYVFTYTASKYVKEDYTNTISYEIMGDISVPVTVAVRTDCGKTMYSLMNKAVTGISEDKKEAVINANDQYNVAANGLLYFIYDEPIFVIFIVFMVMATIVLLVLWFRMREKEAERQYREIDARQKEALREAYEAADRASHAKSDFLSGMSHDIRTPLNAIIGMVAIASAHMGEPGRVSDCLAKISTSSRHLLGLINEVLDMSKIESGKVTLTEEEFNLANLLDNLVELIQPGIKAKGHELIVRIHNIAHEDVIGDSLRIQQAFVNIVGNATKYTPDGGRIEIEVSELDSSASKIGTYQFIFRDNGIGMSQEYVRTIFEPFSRERSSQVDNIQGTGLGMAITKNIVQMMDGSIEVESAPGVGSTFTVIIRLKLQDIKRERMETFAGLSVLVVDDDRSICESTCLALNEIGMESEFVLSGKEALDKVMDTHARGEDYYAVIVDWKMMDMDGLETAKAIRKEIGMEMPIIIFSAYDWSDIEEEARIAGVNTFVSKPLFKSKLIHTFHEILNQNNSVEEVNALELFKQMNLSDKHLLLVEDNVLNREIVNEILGMTSIQIDVAENGEKAVQKFDQSECGYYDLILMDVQMPVMNGYDASMTIRAMDRPDAETVPIIAMTANAFAEDVEKAVAAQMNEHLAKPLDIPKLLEVMNRWLNRKRDDDSVG